MSRRFVTVIAIVILLLIVNAVTFWYLKNSTHDTRVLSDISQIRSALELAYSINTEYPVSGTPLALADRDLGTEKLCKEGFKNFVATCTQTLLGEVPTFYKLDGEKYYYSTPLDGSDYWLEFNLKFNHKKLGLTKGAVCATTSGLISGPCPLN